MSVKKLTHWCIMLLLLTGAAYAAFQVFVVLQPTGHWGPMFFKASDLPHDMMMTRRAYALEFWVITGITLVYLNTRSKLRSDL